MADLTDRLQEVLGAGYRVERELGGAGMSRVFLAEEVALGRQVVVKVLPPELAVGVNAERFRREIQLAAALQHPHIVPLLSAGASRDLVYYVMPFVEGESLRARLAREGELPVPEAIRILRDVVDALAYAHEHQVVHRDIKPDNVLLSGNHAVVTDFGVAKAVTEAGGTDTLTAVGVAMGTPLYMAPEQAAADPHTDHRADIYALGAMGYEMLCGRPPFAGRTTQAVVASHMAETPTPVTQHRPAVAAALNALVMRCLEKKPADRWQRADELMSVLEGMLTPSGGTSAAVLASAATPEGSPTAGRRSRRLRVAGLTAAVVVGVAAIGYLAMRVFGIGPMGTLEGSGKLASRSLLVVSDFSNHTSDSTLAASVTEAFRIDLSQSPEVKLMDAATVTDALVHMDRNPRARLDASTAREVAERDGAAAIVGGDVGRLGSGYVLTARLVSAADGSELAALRETADDSKGIIAAVDRLSRGMRRRIGESLKTIQAAKPLDQVTTSSLEALRLYTEGARAADLAEFTRATELLEQAIALDTTFAMAYRKLAVSVINSQGSRDSALSAVREAYRYRDRLPPRERYLTAALYGPTFGDAIGALNALLGTYPDARLALIDLPSYYTGTGRYADAEAVARRAVSSYPTEPTAYWQLLIALAAQDKLAAVDSFSSRALAKIAGPPLFWSWIRGMVALLHDDVATGTVELDSAREEAGGNLAFRANFGYWMAEIAALQGHLKEATGLDAQVTEADRARGLPGAGLRGAIASATADLRLRDQPTAAVRRLHRALSQVPLSGMPAVDRPYVGLATLYAEAGQAAEARRLMDEYVRDVDSWSRAQNHLLSREWGMHDWDSVTVAEIALAQGHAEEAVARLRRYLDGPHCPLCGLFELGDAYDRAQQPDSAAAYYERLVTTPSWWRINSWSTIPVAYQRLCAYYGKRGSAAKAREYCGDLVHLWKGADPELQPAVRAAQGVMDAVGEGAH